MELTEELVLIKLCFFLLLLLFLLKLKTLAGAGGCLQTNIHHRASTHLPFTAPRNLYPAAGGISEVINDLSQEQLFGEGELKSLARQVKGG